MSKDHWDAILASSPLNATAATVTGKGTGFEPEKAFEELCWDAPPPMVKIGAEHRANGHFVDLTGLQVGRLKVLGLGAGINRWVCRCVCGRYVGRRGTSLKTGRTTMCDACNYTDGLRQRGSSTQARQRAEAPEARKWKTPEEIASAKGEAA